VERYRDQKIDVVAGKFLLFHGGGQTEFIHFGPHTQGLHYQGLPQPACAARMSPQRTRISLSLDLRVPNQKMLSTWRPVDGKHENNKWKCVCNAACHQQDSTLQDLKPGGSSLAPQLRWGWASPLCPSENPTSSQVLPPCLGCQRLSMPKNRRGDGRFTPAAL